MDALATVKEQQWEEERREDGRIGRIWDAFRRADPNVHAWLLRGVLVWRGIPWAIPRDTSRRGA
jgi:hypothetical protein